MKKQKPSQTKNYPPAIGSRPPLLRFRRCGRVASSKWRAGLLKTNNGFTLLMSLVVVSILMSVGLGVYDIVVREFALSISGRESQKAFYAADNGAECSLYWDFNPPVGFVESFATSTDSISEGLVPDVDSGAMFCNDAEITNVAQSAWNVSTISDAATTTFELSFTNGACSNVLVAKYSGGTKIESRGTNIPCDSSEEDRRRVERALRARY